MQVPKPCSTLCQNLYLEINYPSSMCVCTNFQVIQYYANKVISLNADKAQAEVAKQIDQALA